MQNWCETLQIWKSSDGCRTIGVLLFERFSNHCLANAIEPFRAANTLSGRRLYRWQHLSVDGAPVTSSSGLAVRPEMPLDRHDGGAMLFLLPSYGVDRLGTPRTLRALRAASRRFGLVAGMDTGAWLMAEAGLLDGRRATVHWDDLAAFGERFPEVEAVTDSFVAEGDRMTCGGVTTTFDLALHLIGAQHGPMLRLEVAAFFVHAARDRGAFVTLGEADDDRILAALALMRRRMEEAPPLAAIAAELGLSLRGLEDLFRTRLGLTPRAVMKASRLREARRLAEQTRISVAEIAARTGYADATALARACTAAFGAPPSRLRARAAARR